MFNPYSGVKTSILILDRAVAKTSKYVAFFKIENDGFALGAQRKAVKGSQLAQVKAELGAWLQAARAGGGEGLESDLGIAVARERLAEGGDYNLSGERYSSTNEVVRAYPMVPLGEVATLLNGRAYKQEELLDEGPVPVLRVGNFFSNRGWYFSDLELPPEKNCHPGDLLFAWSASFGPKIWDGPKAIYHYHIWKVVPGEQIDKHFLYWVLRAEAESIKAEGSGIAMIHATKSGMEKRLIPLPPLEVQREIVAEVEGYQRVIDGARAVLDNYRPHIPVDPEWPMVPLSEVFDALEVGVSVNSENRAKLADEIGVLKTSAVTSGVFNPDEHKAVLPEEVDRVKCSPRKGSIIISRMNTEALVGASAYVSDDYPDLFLPDRLWQTVITRPDVSAQYIHTVIASDEYRAKISSICGGTSGSIKKVLSFVDGSGFARFFLSDLDRSRLRSFVRPVCAAHMTAGPDEVRVPGPNQTIEL